MLNFIKVILLLICFDYINTNGFVFEYEHNSLSGFLLNQLSNSSTGIDGIDCGVSMFLETKKREYNIASDSTPFYKRTINDFY